MRLFNETHRFSIRKFSIGACSVLIGISFLTARSVEAEEKAEVLPAGESVVVSQPEVSEETENSSTTIPAALPSANTEAEKPVTDSVARKEKEVVVVPDLPVKEEASIKPQEVKFENWEDVLNWQPDGRADDAINKGSVALAERHQGLQVNAQANPEAKVQALSNMNSKAKDHASVGGEEFKAYAFDYWQYLDSMVFWDGLVPTPDVIDAAHRNGVPIYGTLFYNWSSSLKDQERFVETLKEDTEGSKTFPIARKLVDIAKYYGFDGYFINQETTGNLVKPLGPKMRDFLLYTKEYADSIQYPIKYAWYDAMTYEYGRYHENALGEYNYQFMQGDGKHVPVDEFFANFNWSANDTEYSRNTAAYVKRNPFDVYAGLELQKGGSYHTNVNWSGILDENGKLKLSLGLYAPDTITGLGKTGEGYHTHEDLFWTGFQGDPSKGKPADQAWYGLSNLVVDKTPITGSNFNTSFNTGHGKKWFVDGRVSKDGEWNYRSVSGILPTWRWWIQHKDNTPALKGRYDFDQAYNGGNSLTFEGELQADSQQHIHLYSTKIPVSATSKLSVTHKGGEEGQVFVALATDPNFQTYDWHQLTPNKEWATDTFDLSSLTGKTIYGIKLYVNSDKEISNYKVNLGQLSVYDHGEKPAIPTDLVVKAKRLQNAQEAEGVISFKGTTDADYYEVYGKVGDDWKLITGSSASTIYLPKVFRDAKAEGTHQDLKVVAVGKNGIRSDAGILPFDWGMTVADTTLPKALAPNVVLGAKVIDNSFGESDSSEGIEGMLNGTITSLSDKWSSAQLNGTVDIRLTQPRTVVRWVMDHAGAGGESVNDGLMNTKDFDLYFKNDQGEWQLAKAIRGNKAHVTDVTLDQPITAQDWRLHVLTSDNGTPWKAIRIYNWKMYEELDTETPNIPMKHAAARDLGDQHIQVGFKDVPAHTKVSLYAKSTDTEPIATLETDQEGDLIFDPIEMKEIPNLLYYRAQADGKDWSNVLAIPISSQGKKITSIRLEHPLEKKVYHQGTALSLKGASLRVQFEGEEADEVIALTNQAVKVTGFDSNKLGEQELHLQYLGHDVTADLKVFVLDRDPNAEAVALGLEMKHYPKTEYIVGEELELADGGFDIVYDDEHVEHKQLTDEGVQISGYHPDQEGRQTITVSYEGLSTTYQVLVSPKPALNDEYLRQTLSAAEAAKSTAQYTFADQALQEDLVKQIEKSQAILADHEHSSQEQVNEQLTVLTASLKALNGQENRDTAVKDLRSWIQETTATAEKLPNHPASQPFLQLATETEQALKSDALLPHDLQKLRQGLEQLADGLKKAGTIHFEDKEQGVSVHFSTNEPQLIQGIRVVKVEASEKEQQVFEGAPALVYDIEAVTAENQDVATRYPAEVTIRVQEGQSVVKVLYLPEEGAAESLGFVQNGTFVTFTAPHFTHYALVFKQKEETGVVPGGPGEHEQNPGSKPTDAEDSPKESEKANGVILVKEQQKAAPQLESLAMQESAEEKVTIEESTIPEEKSLPQTGEEFQYLWAEALILASLGLAALKKKEE